MQAKSISRRKLLQMMGTTGATALGLPVLAIATAKAVDNLKPGDYTWHPEKSPSGPVAIIVSLPEQRVYVYRNGIEIAVSTCSTGKPGHSTPTGVFTILQKDKHHHSSTYNNAPMPNMNRLTWSGIALHAGKLPGYPASHGCVRLPLAFSEKLFTVTHLGTPVIIANAHSAPADVVHPGQVLSADARGEFAHVADTKAKTPPAAHPVAQVAAASEVPDPEIDPRDNIDAPSGPAVVPVPATAILVSSADQRIMVLDNGEIVAEGSATITEPATPLGHHVFVLSDVNDTDSQLHWHTFGFSHEIGADVDAADLATIQRIRGEHAVIEAIRTRMHPGTIMVTVDQPLHEDTRTAQDFVVMTTEAS
ncbi:MAG: L,D-transpeptidase [Bauldia sp.]|uniref:L,D-transpeptidase n=1 Tax=Bauldia sp. TaxID=2575872 RepID=UPI001DB517B5|nr:L,D-transpeptidase [Bauldia sp.]MCB1495395.1 L,D-transpeptidase [Bauldia sp.]